MSEHHYRRILRSLIVNTKTAKDVIQQIIIKAPECDLWWMTNDMVRYASAEMDAIEITKNVEHLPEFIRQMKYIADAVRVVEPVYSNLLRADEVLRGIGLDIRRPKQEILAHLAVHVEKSETFRTVYDFVNGTKFDNFVLVELVGGITKAKKMYNLWRALDTMAMYRALFTP